MFVEEGDYLLFLSSVGASCRPVGAFEKKKGIFPPIATNMALLRS